MFSQQRAFSLVTSDYITSNNETLSHSHQKFWPGNIAKSRTSEGNRAMLLANVDRRPPLQGGLMNFQLQNSQF